MMLVTLVALALASAVPPAKPAQLAELVNPAEVASTVTTLSGFGTRHSLSDRTSDTRGIGAAARWLKKHLESAPSPAAGFAVQLEDFEAPKTTRTPEGALLTNVVAIIPGTREDSKTRAYYVVGHYDSRNAEAMDATGDAPGANDNASGTAVAVEIGRILASRPLESTVIILLTAGEEQSLLGAKYHAAGSPVHKGLRIMAVLNNDIVGDPIMDPHAQGMPFVRVFSEGTPRLASEEERARIRANAAENDSPSRQLARFVGSVGTLYNLPLRPRMVLRPDRFLRGGDHSAFNDAGFPAIRFTAAQEDYSRQHVGITQRDGITYGDLPRFIDAPYIGGVTKLNIAVLASLANAPSPPADVAIDTKSLATTTTLNWLASPEGDVAGYEIAVRSTTDADWTRFIDVGAVTTQTLDISKDDHFFGVRAYDKDGYRSPVSFAYAAGR
jgi:hypothetical protein